MPTTRAELHARQSNPGLQHGAIAPLHSAHRLYPVTSKNGMSSIRSVNRHAQIFLISCYIVPVLARKAARFILALMERPTLSFLSYALSPDAIEQGRHQGPELAGRCLQPVSPGPILTPEEREASTQAMAFAKQGFLVAEGAVLPLDKPPYLCGLDLAPLV